ncbi:MAG: DNA-binding protein, partial [Gaiellales bacterium]
MQLLRGDLPREDIAAWAMQWVSADAPGVSDRVVWSALKHLAGADLLAGPSVYLHGEDDIHAWIDEVDGAN